MNDTSTASAEALRQQMVDRTIARGWPRSAAVADAIRSVPRHPFVPDTRIDEAYADQAVITKRAANGTPLSCASEPVVVAMMLDQLDVRPGHHALEIGAGTGYNAALLAHLTGLDGQTTTIDIDPEVATNTRRNLDATGYSRVLVATRDGALGYADRAPYHRIIVSVGAWDLPPAWWDQLAPDGRLVVPLRWRGQTRSIAFAHTGDHLRSDSVHLCGFVPMIGQDGERGAPIDSAGEVSLYWDVDQEIVLAELRDVLDQPRHTVWSAVTVGGEDPFEGVWLRMTANEPGTCRIAATRAAVDSGLSAPAIPSRSPALVENGSLAYLTLRRLIGGDEPRWELGAIGHGAAGWDLANRIAVQVQLWDLDRGAVSVITAHRRSEADRAVDGPYRVGKPHTVLVLQ